MIRKMLAVFALAAGSLLLAPPPAEAGTEDCFWGCHDGAMSVYEAGGYEAGRRAFERCMDSFCGGM